MQAAFIFTSILALAFYGLSRVKFVYVVRRRAPRAKRSLAGAATAGRCVIPPASGKTRKSTPASDMPRRLSVVESDQQRSKRESVVSALVNQGAARSKARDVAQKVCRENPAESLNELLWIAMREAA